MIIDTLQNSSRYTSLNEGFAKGFAFIEKCVEKGCEVGKFEIDGTNVYALVQSYDTLPLEQTKWEAHQQYIDIQFILEGCEVIGWKPLEKLPQGTAYNAEKDCYLYQGDEGTELQMEPLTFAIFYPEDLHRPKTCSKSPSTVKKIVVKIKVAL